MIDFEGDQALALGPKDWERMGIQWSFREYRPILPSPLKMSPVQLKTHPVDRQTYTGMFKVVMDALKFGDSFLANLTVATPVECTLGLEEIFRYSDAPYKVLWPGKFVVFSPERFVRIRSGRIYTHPMKGTSKDELDAGGRSLLENIKEFEEQATVVDLMRNDIGMVARDVRVDKFRYLESIRTSHGTIWQTSSQISGSLPANYREQIGTILATMLPAGSISGAPKKRTLEIIREAEPVSRGWYTGVCGYFDGFDLDSAVMIRFIEEGPKGLIFRSGGGITARSTPDQEYQEMKDKVYVPIY